MIRKAAQYPHGSTAVLTLLIIFLTIPLSALLILLTIIVGGTLTRAAENIDITVSAVQSLYQSGVPHTDSKGNFRTSLAADSFLPNGLYYPSSGSLGTIGGAGFNSVILTDAQDPNSFLAESAASKVKLIPNVQDSGHCKPVPATPVKLPQYLPGLKDNANVLGWHLWDDPLVCHSVAADTTLPSTVGPDPTPTYNFLNNEISTYGVQTNQPLFSVDAGPFGDSWVTWWNQFANQGDAVAHYNYPVTTNFLALSGDKKDPLAALENAPLFLKSKLKALKKSFVSAFRRLGTSDAYASATTDSLTFSWGRPTGVATFVDSGNKTASCSGTGTSCSTGPNVYWPGSSLIYRVNRSSSGGPEIGSGGTSATSDGRGSTSWSWTYVAVAYPSSFADCLAAGGQCQTKTINSDEASVSATFTDLTPGTSYEERVCSPNCSSSVIFTRTESTDALPTPTLTPTPTPSASPASGTYVYWVHKKGSLDSGCCSSNPTAASTATSHTFTLNTVPDPAGYEGVVCSPDCNGTVVSSGPVVFSPNAVGGQVTLTATGTPPPSANGTFSPIADLAKKQANAVGANKPAWFVLQDWAGSFFLTNWRHPSKVEARSMAYTALIHGATGLFHFVYDSPIVRASCEEGVIGISPNTPASYPSACKTADSTQTASSVNLWNSLDASKNGINKEILQLSPVILSATSADPYQVFVDKTPISPAPIRTILKKYMGEYYLLAVNMDNATISGRFVFPGKQFAKAEVLFEDRNATIGNQNEIVDSFSAFDVNVYKLTLANTVGTVVQSSRQVCSLHGQNQTSLGIGGMDGGTSVKVGTDSFFTFGDNTNLTGGLFLPNSIAKTNDTDAGDCIALVNKTSGGTAQSLMSKLPDELLVWPDGMVNTSASNNYFYYMSVRGCAQPEPCASQPLGSWKVRGIGLAKYDTTSMNSTRVGSCSPVSNCLFWKEGDTGIEIAGATAYKHTDGYVYLFLNESANGVFQDTVRIARVAVGSIENKVAYQYWNGSSWISSLSDSARVMTFTGGFNGASIAYNAALGKWTAIYTTNNFSAVGMRTADSITGPWSTADEILVDCNSIFSADKTLKCYFGRQHSQFEKNSGQTIYVSYANQSTYKPYLHEIVLKIAAPVDTDGDGCTDLKELGPVPNLGGDRNPNDPWDFYDVDGSKSIGLADTQLILAHYGHGPNDDPLDNKLDRKAVNPLKPYQTSEDNNGIGLADAMLNLKSFGHSCAQ